MGEAQLFGEYKRVRALWSSLTYDTDPEQVLVRRDLDNSLTDMSDALTTDQEERLWTNMGGLKPS